MNNRQHANGDQLNLLQKGMNYALSLLTMVGYAQYAHNNVTSKSFKVQEMVVAGWAPFGKTFAASLNYEKDSYQRYLSNNLSTKSVLTFLMGITAGLLAGLGAGYLIENFDADMLASDSELLQEFEFILKSNPSSTAITAFLGYAAFSLATSLLQKFWVKEDQVEIERVATAPIAARVINTALTYDLIRQSLVTAKETDILRNPLSGVLIAAVEQFTTAWYAAANTPHPINEILGQNDAEPLPAAINGDEPRPAVSPAVQAVANLSWYSLRVALVLSAGYAVNAALESVCGSKEDMSSTKQFYASSFVALAGIATEKVYNDPKGALQSVVNAGLAAGSLMKNAGAGCYGRLFSRSTALPAEAEPIMQQQAVSYGSNHSV